MTWVGNHLNDGIRSTELSKVDRPEIHNGPYLWAGVKSKYFVMAVLPGAETGEDGPYIGGVITGAEAVDVRSRRRGGAAAIATIPGHRSDPRRRD